jgi:hypothetical protein
MAGTLLSTSFLAGVPVHVVAARLGHAAPAVTCASTPTSCASTQPVSGTSSPKPSRLLFSKSPSQTGEDDQ